MPARMALPDSIPIPNIPVKLPSFSLPRWTPVPVPLDEHPLMQEPKTSPKKEETKEEPKPKKLPVPEPQLPPLPAIPEYLLKPDPLIPPVIENVKPIKKDVAIIEVPILGEIPLPTRDVLITVSSTAAVAATVSVAATMGGTALLKYLTTAFKPILKFLLKRILKRKQPTWARQRRSLGLRQRTLGKRDC